MPLLKFPRSPVILHPAVVALLTWSTVGVLYSMHLSNVLIYGPADVVYTCFLIVGPILAVSLGYRILHTRFLGRRGPLTWLREETTAGLIAERLRWLTILWVILAVIETVVSGGVPLVWILIGNGKANWDYGISSVHGVVNALMMSTALGYLALYLFTGQRRYLRFPVFAALWALVEVSRGTLMVLMLEYAVLVLRLRPIRPKTLVRLATGAFGLLLLFGYVGDVRTGADAFKALARPTERYPDWAPSGLLWAYIYITTPLNNLMYTMHIRAPANNPLFPATAATLFPTVLRLKLYGDVAGVLDVEGGELVVPQLTVSTAYVGPYQDMGTIGIISFSTLLGLLCEMFWHRHGFFSPFVFCVFSQALILSLFYPLLLALPILAQLPWFYFVCRPEGEASHAWSGRSLAT